MQNSSPPYLPTISTAQRFGQLLDNAVSNTVAIVIIDGLEVIYIKH